MKTSFFYIYLAAAVGLLFVQAASAQYITLTAQYPAKPSSQMITLATNELATVVHFITPVSASDGWLEVVSGGVTQKYYNTVEWTSGPVIAGPATLRAVSADVGYVSLCTLQITKPTSTFVPVNTVVIPNDNGAPVQVILESSTDMIKWNAASPGTYGTSATNRFFRVRAER